YPYDLAQARRLLRQAGYQHGFSLELTTPVFGGTNLVAQAVGGYWKALGVAVKVRPAVGPAAWSEAVVSKRYPLHGYIYAVLPEFLSAKNWLAPTPNPFNVWATHDPEIDALLARAGRAPAGPARDALYAQVRTRASSLDWSAPVARLDTIYVSRKELKLDA